MAGTLAKKFGSSAVLTSQNVRARSGLKDMSFLYSSFALAVVFVAALFGYIWFRLLVVDTGYDISRASQARDSLIEQNRRLRIEFMKLKSPERIEEIASKELNLAHPSAEQIVNVR